MENKGHTNKRNSQSRNIYSSQNVKINKNSSENFSDKNNENIRKTNVSKNRKVPQKTEIFNKSTQNFSKVNKNISENLSNARTSGSNSIQYSKGDFLPPKIKSFFTPRVTVFTILLFIFLIFAICISINIIVGIKTITVSGNDLATRDEILSVAEISEQSGYFGFNSKKIEEKILKYVPNVTEVKVKRSMLGNVTITLTEQKAYFYAYTSNQYFALSKSLEILKSSDEKDEFINRKLIRIDFPEVKSAILGNVIEFSDSGRDCSFVNELLQGVLNSKMYEDQRINQICIEDKFNIYIVSDLKYKIFIGKSTKINEKLFSAEKALCDEVFSDGEKWEIDVSDISNITSRRNSKLDFSYLMLKNHK